MKTLSKFSTQEPWLLGFKVTLLIIVSGFLAITFLPNAEAQTPSTNGLLAYYPLEGNANDASGHNYNGTEFNGVTYTPHLGGLGAHFAGSAYISLPSNIPSDSSVTVTFWVRTSASTPNTWPNNLFLVT